MHGSVKGVEGRLAPPNVGRNGLVEMWLLARPAGISQRSSPGQRGRRVSWMYGMDSVGRLSGPLVGGFLAAALGPRSPFVAYAVLSLVALLTTLRLSHDGPVRHAASEPARGVNRMSIRELVLPRLAFFGVAFFSAAARGPIYASMLHLYAAFAYNLDAPGIGILGTADSAMGIPIGFVSGRLMDHFGRKVTMVPGFTGVTVTMLFLAVIAFLNLSLVWYIAAFLATLAAQSLTGGSIQTVGADVAPPHARGMLRACGDSPASLAKHSVRSCSPFLPNRQATEPRSCSSPRPRWPPPSYC